MQLLRLGKLLLTLGYAISQSIQNHLPIYQQVYIKKESPKEADHVLQVHTKLRINSKYVRI